MKILVTGAAGYIGNKLAHTLANQGHKIHALIRSAGGEKYLQHPNIKIFKGDILDTQSVAAAVEECRQVYHTAGAVKLWAKDPNIFYEQNVIGTINVLEAALKEGVNKLVFTS